MLSNSILVGKLVGHCKQSRPTQASLAACCKEVQQNFKFDCTFIAYSTTPEETLTPLAFEGKEEIMDTCLYRLGVEERVALSRLPLKTYSDMTGKPVFNKSGSLRIQKPNSGIFMVYYRAKEDFLLLGCAHQDPLPYDQTLLTDLSNLWKSWQENLREAVQKIIKSGKVEPPQTTIMSAPTPKVESPSLTIKAQAPIASASPVTPGVPSLVSNVSVKNKEMEKDKDSRRPVVLVDEVTRLFNKDYFEECLAIEVERAKRYSRELSLIFLSVSPVNGTELGAKEDSIATQVAEILYKSLRRVDIICRLEKNKYGMILPDTANNTYGIIAKRIFKYFKQIMGEVPSVFLNISASTYPKHAGNHLLLFENAEKLLLQAQEVGPNKAVLPE
jgi:diguanylate cyclase (GGDEF)-like protein